MKFGMVGLGRMGNGLLQRAIAAGHECVAFDPNASAVAAAEAAGAIGVSSLAEMAAALGPRRLVWVMVPVKVTGDVLSDLAAVLSPGDIAIDGGNSFFRDSVDRAATLAEADLTLLDIGTSGGVFGRDRGFCLMIGGPDDAVAHARPLFEALAPGMDAAPRTPGRSGESSDAERGFLHCGPSGAGHFAKMVHNGIEYAAMAALAEGFNLLAHADAGRKDDDAGNRYYKYEFDVSELAEVWRRGSVISSWLLDLTATALHDDRFLEAFGGQVSDSGEGRWTAKAAIDLAVPAHTLTAALFDRFASRGRGDLANKLLSAMRKQFGGHQEPGDSQ